MSGPAGTQRGDRARAGTDVAGVARSAWDTRPARRAEDTKIAGVAGAIARRYDLDPTLVRVAFVVWAIVGGGLLLYLLGWLVLPADPADPPRRDRVAGGRGPRRDHHDGRRPSGPPVLVVLLTVIVAAGTLAPAFSGRVVTLVALGLAGLALYLVHTARADLGVPGIPGTAGPGATPWSAPEAEPWAAHDDASLAWDPLGAAPRGWSLPAEPPVHTPAGDPVRRPRSVLTPVTLALALVAAGLAGAALLTGLPGVTPVWIPAAALAVVGLGLVGGSIAARRPRRGLVIAAVPLILATVFGSIAATQPAWQGPWNGPDGSVTRGAGDVSEAPTSAAMVSPDYRTGLGDVDLDLTRLAVAPGGAPIRTTVESGAGDVTVRVPANADVTVTCQHGVGDMNCLGSTSDVTNRVDLGSDGPGGPVIDLTARSGAGDLAVTRG
ncbi:PspC domain-containing protein [Actinomycetospora endophytica]|uniref:PspC domain-containing protein n=1 Tax=Actinomycetospora endophytica TaxID=2291215 RepID=A0ABS8P615_9PSEU|nr:PspC domain-containing protein [Actinomycetospora endophytica]MCD2192474.1 PspC domain-containing protein [Actinomycetospora endophytica]